MPRCGHTKPYISTRYIYISNHLCERRKYANYAAHVPQILRCGLPITHQVRYAVTIRSLYKNFIVKPKVFVLFLFGAVVDKWHHIDVKFLKHGGLCYIYILDSIWSFKVCNFFCELPLINRVNQLAVSFYEWVSGTRSNREDNYNISCFILNTSKHNRRLLTAYFKWRRSTVCQAVNLIQNITIELVY